MNVNLAPWLHFALGSAFVAGLTVILGRLGVAGLNANLATLIQAIGDSHHQSALRRAWQRSAARARRESQSGRTCGSRP